MAREWVGSAVALATLLAWPVIAGAETVSYGLRTTTNARYQNLVAAQQTHEVALPALSLPAVAESRSHVAVGGPTGLGRVDRVTAYDDADAWAKITHPGVERSYARAGGRTPQDGPSNLVQATALAESTTKWMAVGPVGQMVSIDLNYFLDGWLFTGRAGDWTPQLSSQINVVMRIDRGGEQGFETMFWATGSLFHSEEFRRSFQTMNGWSDADWISAWSDTSGTLTSTAGNDRMYDLNYAEFIPAMFEIQSNTPFTLYYSVSVSARNALGPSGAFATADFSNTAGMSFSTSMPGFTVQGLNVVPEPSALLGLGLTVFCVCRHRRA
jgi:hypothetical protein